MSTKKKVDTQEGWIFDTQGTFRWPVIVRVPSPDNPGSKLKVKFIAEFKHVDQERRLELINEHRSALERLKNESIEQDGSAEDDANDQVSELFNMGQRVLDEVLVGFAKVLDTNRQPIPYTPETKRALITHQMAWPAIFKAYNDAISQQDLRGN